MLIVKSIIHQGKRRHCECSHLTFTETEEAVWCQVDLISTECIADQTCDI